MFFFEPNPEVVAHNSAALGEGLALAERMAAAHLSALQELERIDMTDSVTLQAEAGLLYHALNMFAELMDQVLGGRFDTALYLLRPTFDIGSMIFVTRRSEELARQMIEEQLSASDARKHVVEMLREAGFAEEADRIESDWKRESKNIQFASHVHVQHLFGLLEEREGGSVAIAGGRPDEGEALRQGRIAIAGEMRTLSYFRSNHGEDLTAEIRSELERLEAATRAWLTDATEYDE